MGDGLIIQMYIHTNPPFDRLLLPLTVPVFPRPETLQGINSSMLLRRGKVSCWLYHSWGDGEILGPKNFFKGSEPILLILATPLCIPTANNLHSINHISAWLSLLPVQDSAFLTLLSQLYSSFCFTASKFICCFLLLILLILMALCLKNSLYCHFSRVGEGTKLDAYVQSGMLTQKPRKFYIEGKVMLSLLLNLEQQLKPGYQKPGSVRVQNLDTVIQPGNEPYVCHLLDF